MWLDALFQDDVLQPGAQPSSPPQPQPMTNVVAGGGNENDPALLNTPSERQQLTATVKSPASKDTTDISTPYPRKGGLHGGELEGLIPKYPHGVRKARERRTQKRGKFGLRGTDRRPVRQRAKEFEVVVETSGDCLLEQVSQMERYCLRVREHVVGLW